MTDYRVSQTVTFEVDVAAEDIAAAMTAAADMTRTVFREKYGRAMRVHIVASDAVGRPVQSQPSSSHGPCAGVHLFQYNAKLDLETCVLCGMGRNVVRVARRRKGGATR